MKKSEEIRENANLGFKLIEDDLKDQINKLESKAMTLEALEQPSSTDLQNLALNLKIRTQQKFKLHQLEDCLKQSLVACQGFQRAYPERQDINLILMIHEAASYYSALETVSEIPQRITLLDLVQSNYDSLSEMIERDPLYKENKPFQLKWVLLAKSALLLKDYQLALQINSEAIEHFFKHLPQKDFKSQILLLQAQLFAQNMNFYMAEQALIQYRINVYIDLGKEGRQSEKKSGDR